VLLSRFWRRFGICAIAAAALDDYTESESERASERATAGDDVVRMHASRDDVDSNLLSTAPIVHAAVATNECMGHLPHNRSFTAHKLN